MLTVPAAISGQFVKDMKKMMVLASILGVLFTTTGLWLSYFLNLTSGATIILVSGAAYLLAIRFAAPALVAVFLATVSLSFIARAIPQFNMISVGFPVQISTATLVLIISLGSVCLVFQTNLTQAFESVTRLFGP